jgi:diacylglycerol O-acyltransferase / wax synthase
MSETRWLSPADALFVYGESRETPQHVGSLLRFSPAADASPEFLRRVVDEIRREPSVAGPWNQRLATPWLQYSPVHSWVADENFDIDYHVRRTAVPAPGDERELGIVVARLHTNPLDLSKPPWELHFIEGLQDGSFAIYMKVHHALVDGYTMVKAMETAFSPDAQSPDTPLPFQVPLDQQPPQPGADSLLFADRVNYLRQSTRDLRSLLALSRAQTRLLLRRRGPLVGSLDAPDSIFNQRITRNRRFATQQYPLAQLKALAKAAGATLNDVVLAVCGGALRTYLLEQDELPDAPLIAMVPVNVRPKGDPGGGNAVGAMLASLGTDVADPVERVRAVNDSTRRAKEQLEGLTKEAILGYSGALMAPAALQTLSAIAGTGAGQPRTFNVTVSNVPGPTEPLYFRGARLDAPYPLSIVGHGLALNITVFSYAGTLTFGFTGCRDTVPHLQRLAVYTGDALAALDAALSAAST